MLLMEKHERKSSGVQGKDIYVHNDVSDITNEEIQLKTNDQVFSNVLLTGIGANTIPYSFLKKRRRENIEKDLIKEINNLSDDNEIIYLIGEKQNE
ncbi:hypothetical protein CHS0354_008615 [Potamilus streckersoni]|uniref:Uncharacterized protein n=1 Tax=Potamilus streckersoni TaxID=2493646 RepID=A0AAE0SVB5_9BIVA|nr:hypothetical protein CHS0354_008615 [Potamilus streckersoni]